MEIVPSGLFTQSPDCEKAESPQREPPRPLSPLANAAGNAQRSRSPHTVPR